MDIQTTVIIRCTSAICINYQKLVGPSINTMDFFHSSSKFRVPSLLGSEATAFQR